ncbi:hypothetical protein ABZ404_39145 [Streptomyces sp. NPDC005878]|uniref:hypothetical protein n=1 Tax=Streptomyces sp. NPDC005878 TaxID=3157077 RepID=UPI0033FBD9C2
MTDTTAPEASEPSMGDPQHAVKIEATGWGATITVDGHDLSRKLRGYTIEQQAGQPALVVLYKKKDADPIGFEGLAQVAVAHAFEEPKPVDEGAVVAVFLANIDPVALENAALNRDDLGNDRYELTRAMLRQLADWAQGKG